MTLIEIRPDRWGWSVFEAPGVEPVFPEKQDAIDYAQCRVCFRSGEIRVWIQTAISSARSRSQNQIGNCEASANVSQS